MRNKSLILVAVIVCLAGTGTRAADADIAALVKALSSGDDAARVAAADELGKLGPAAKQAVPALVKALGGSADELRSHAASCSTGCSGVA